MGGSNLTAGSDVSLSGNAVSLNALGRSLVFDAHMHIGDFPLFGVALDGDGLAATMSSNGIGKGVIFCPDNAYTLRVVESMPDVYGMVWVNPREPHYVEDAARYLDHPKFLGAKLHPLLDGYLPADPAIHPVMRLLLERGLPVLIHSGHPIFSLPWSIEELAVAFPDNKIIMGHMGHSNVVYINAAIDIASRRQNVYLETSGMPMHTKIREAVERVGPERVLYGSDAPFHHPEVEMLKVRLSGLSDELVGRVLRSNSEQLFGVPCG